MRAPEAPDIANEVVDISKPIRTTVASKRAPKKPKVGSVSVDKKVFI